MYGMMVMSGVRNFDIAFLFLLYLYANTSSSWIQYTKNPRAYRSETLSEKSTMPVPW